MFECLSQFGYFLAQGKVGTRDYRISGCYNKLFATFLNPGKITQSKSLLTPMSERLRDERLKKQKHVKCDFFLKRTLISTAITFCLLSIQSHSGNKKSPLYL